MRGSVDIDRGWAWLVLIAVYLGIIILSTTMFMGGVLYVALLDNYNGDEAKTSLVGALNGGLLCLLGPMASLLMKAFSCRICMFLGGLLLTLSCLTSAFVGNVDCLILTYGILGGIGNCLASTPFVVVLGYYFHKRRNQVIAISQAVIGLGFFLASPLALIILRSFSLQGTFLILGGINAHLCVIAIICKPSSIEQIILNGKSQDRAKSSAKPETRTNIAEETAFLEADKANLQIDNDTKGNRESFEIVENKYRLTLQFVNHLERSEKIETENDDKETTVCNKLIESSIYNETDSEPVSVFEIKERTDDQLARSVQISSLARDNGKDTKTATCRGAGLFNLHLIKDIRFLMFLCSTLSWNFTLSLCIMHLPNYMNVRGAGDVEISAIMTCFSASNLTGRFIAAMTVDKGGIDSLTLHVGMLGVAGVVAATFPLYSGVVGDYIFAAAIGLYTGGPNSLMTPITLKMISIEDLSAAHGLEYFFSGLGYVPGPFIAGLLYSFSGAYELSFICGGCILLLGCLLAMVSAVKLQNPQEANM